MNDGKRANKKAVLLDVDLIKRRFDEQVAAASARRGNPFDEPFWGDLCPSLIGLPVGPTKVRVKTGKVKIPELGWIKAHTRECS